MKRILLTFLCVSIGISLSLLVGCGSESADDVVQDRIYTYYRFSYDAATNTTTAQARFTFGSLAGTRLTLGSNSNITCNGQPLTQTTELLNQTLYEGSFTGSVASGEFKWTDNDGKVFINTVDIPTSIDYPTGLTTIDRSASVDLEWQGDPVSPSEDVRCIINNVHVFSQAFNNATTVTLTTSRLQNISAGVANMELNRVKNSQLAQKTAAGGLAEGVYRAGEKAITLQ